jgi:tetratricopeptide (TPR) repeat protein
MSRAKRTVDVERLSALAQSAYANKKMDVVLDLTSRILEVDPKNVGALKLKARVHAQRGESDMAEPIWRRLCDTGPDKTEPALGLARIAHARGDWDEMASFADLAVRENAKRTDALRLAITARVRAKRPDELPALLLRLHALEPGRSMALLKTLSSPELAQAQALVLARLGSNAPVDPALESLTRDCRKAWEVGARRAASMRDDEVQACYLRAVWSFDPGARAALDTLNALSRERLKFLRMAIKQGDDDAALQQAEVAARFNPTSFEAWFAIARLSALADPQRSAESFRMCADLKPSDVYYRYRYGLALMQSGRFEDAIEALRAVLDGVEDVTDPIATAALAEIPGLSRTIFERAMLAVRAGRVGEARTLYLAATGPVTGAGLPTGARAMFWAGLSAAQIRVAFGSIGEGAGKIWKRTKTRSARLRRSILGQSGAAAMQHGARAGE